MTKIYFNYNRDAVQNGMTTLQRDFEQLAREASSWNLSLNRASVLYDSHEGLLDGVIFGVILNMNWVVLLWRL